MYRTIKIKVTKETKKYIENKAKEFHFDMNVMILEAIENYLLKLKK